MRSKKADTIQLVDNPDVNAGNRKLEERLRSRYLSNPLFNPRLNVGNLKPRFSDINRGLPLLEHLQRYLPEGSFHEGLSTLDLPHPRRVARKDNRHSGQAADNWLQSPTVVEHLTPLTRTATTEIGRQSLHKPPISSSMGSEQPHHAGTPETAGNDTRLSAQGERLRARYLRTPLTHKSTSVRFQRESVISVKFIPHHLSALTSNAGSKAAPVATAQYRAPQTSNGKAGFAPGIKTDLYKGVKGVVQRRIWTDTNLHSKSKSDGRGRSFHASYQSSRVLRRSNATIRKDAKGIHPKAFSGDESESSLQPVAPAGSVPAPGSVNEFAVRPQTTHRHVQTLRQDIKMDSDGPKSVRPKFLPTSLTIASTTEKSTVNRAVMHTVEELRRGRGAVDVSSGIADQTVASIKPKKTNLSSIEDKSGILNVLPLVSPKRLNSSTADTTSTANVIRLQHRRDDDSSLPMIPPLSPAQLKSGQALDRQHSMNIPISNGYVPTGSLQSSGGDPTAPGMFSSPDLPVVKSSPHGIAAKWNESAGATVTAPRRLLLRRNESPSADGMPLTLARSTRVGQSPSMTSRTESPDPAGIASEPTTPIRDDSEPDPVQTQEIKTDELVERVMRKVLRTFSIERERRGWFPWN